jgi:hypothetical protein
VIWEDCMYISFPLVLVYSITQIHFYIRERERESHTSIMMMQGEGKDR